MKRRTALITAGVLVGTVAVAGVAWALLGGVITGANVAVGEATNANTNCQTGAVNFTYGDPVWDNASQTFQIDTVAFSGFSTDCVTASATLSIAVTNGTTTFAEEFLVPTAAVGNITLGNPLDAEAVAAYSIAYAVN